MQELQLLVQSLTRKVGEAEERYSLLLEQADSLKELLVTEKEQYSQKESMYKQNVGFQSTQLLHISVYGNRSIATKCMHLVMLPSLNLILLSVMKSEAIICLMMHPVFVSRSRHSKTSLFRKIPS